MTARALRGRLLLIPCLALALTAGADAARTQADKSIFVSVLDTAGKPVTDMTGDHFAIREDGMDREVVSAKISTEPLYIALLVDTSKEAEEYITDIRAGFRAFIQDVLAKSPESQISLWEFGQASIRIKDFTSDAAALDKEAARIFPKPNSASVLLEALHDTSEALGKRSGRRRAIVALNIEPGNEQSAQEPNKIQESLLKSRAQLWALSVQKGSLKDPKRDIVLGALTRNAGGVREFIVAQSAIESYMRRYAAALTSQYEVVYRRPSGTPRVVQTGVKREGVKLIAGIFAPR